ncbi:alkaline phosphatase family protein, partial [Candidatus Bipolaricaulota bacterium]|nr:alkaline phosphatase family protein [Candidatus Bipolaricaulota bacterium]
MTTFVIALDGASPDLLNRWIDQGNLTNLSKIREQGLSGNLESTFPPLTGPAWSSFHTGVNPGKHGVYTWLDMADSYKGKVINNNSIKAQTIWKQISSLGGEIGLLSVPVTYPPEKVNGFVVPGFLTPSAATERSYPRDVASKLFEEIPNYEYLPEPYMVGKTPKSWVAELRKAVRARGEASRFLYKNFLNHQDQEVFMVHYFATDQVQHFLWDEVTEEWDPRLEVFEEVDSEIGRLMEVAPDDAVFLIISDHGFGPVERTFNINKWLQTQGHFALKRDLATTLKRGLAGVGFTEQNTQPIGEMIYPLAKKLKIVDNPITGLATNDALNSLFLSSKDVNWSGTQAYSRSHIGHIRINLRGREGEGAVSDADYDRIREEIMLKLSDLEVPNTGKKLAEWVKPKEDLYSGPYIYDAPDILFNPLEGDKCAGSIVGYGAILFFNSTVFSKKIHPGHHRRDGILMAYGKGVESRHQDASLMDVAPTLLNLNSYPVPEQMDGQVIGGISSREPEFYQAKDFYKSRPGA